LGDQIGAQQRLLGTSATTPPYNQKKVLRHYGFGAQGNWLGGYIDRFE